MKVTSMSCGSSHTVVVMDGREMFTWGQGEDGQLGHGDAEERHRPCKVKLVCADIDIHRYRNMCVCLCARFNDCRRLVV